MQDLKVAESSEPEEGFGAISSRMLAQPGTLHPLRDIRQFKEAVKVLAVAIASQELNLPPEIFSVMDGNPDNFGKKDSPFHKGLREERRREFVLIDNRAFDPGNNRESLGTTLCLLHVRIEEGRRGLLPIITPYATPGDTGQTVASALEKKLIIEMTHEEREELRQSITNPVDKKEKERELQKKIQGLKEWFQKCGEQIASIVTPLLIIAGIGGAIYGGVRGVQGHIENLQVTRSSEMKRLIGAATQTQDDGTIKVNRRVIEQIDLDMVGALRGELYEKEPARKRDALQTFDRWSELEGGQARALSNGWEISYKTAPSLTEEILTDFVRSEADPQIRSEASAILNRVAAYGRTELIQQAERMVSAVQDEESKERLELLIEPLTMSHLEILKEELVSPDVKIRGTAVWKIWLLATTYDSTHSPQFSGTAQKWMKERLINEDNSEVRDQLLKGIDNLEQYVETR